MRLLHCSDLHLGRRPVGGKGEFSEKRYLDYFNAFEQCVDIAIREKVDLFIMSGDIFDRKEIVPEVLEKSEKILKKLSDAQIFSVAIEGNHDNIIHAKEDESWINYLVKKGYFKRPSYLYDGEKYIFDKIEFMGYQIYGLGYPGFMVNELLAEFAKTLEDNKKNIILVHTAIGGGDFLPGLVKKETLDIFKNKALYIAGGHFHSRMCYPNEEPFFFLPGSTEYWDLEEKKGEKGVIIFDTDTKKYDFIDLDIRNKNEISLEVESDDEEKFKLEFELKVLKNIFTERETIYIIKIYSDKNYYIDTSWCENEILNKGGLKAVIKVLYKNEIKSGSFENGMSNIENIEKEIIKKWDLFSQKTDIVANTLSKLKIYQQEKMENEFLSYFDFLLNDLIIGGGENNENK